MACRGEGGTRAVLAGSGSSSHLAPGIGLLSLSFSRSTAVLRGDYSGVVVAYCGVVWCGVWCVSCGLNVPVL